MLKQLLSLLFIDCLIIFAYFNHKVFTIKTHANKSFELQSNISNHNENISEIHLQALNDAKQFVDYQIKMNQRENRILNDMRRMIHEAIKNETLSIKNDSKLENAYSVHERAIRFGRRRKLINLRRTTNRRVVTTVKHDSVDAFQFGPPPPPQQQQSLNQPPPQHDIHSSSLEQSPPLSSSYNHNPMQDNERYRIKNEYRMKVVDTLGQLMNNYYARKQNSLHKNSPIGYDSYMDPYGQHSNYNPSSMNSQQHSKTAQSNEYDYH